MLEKMKNIIKANDLCVLATVSEGRPHCSLMSYISDHEVREIDLVSFSCVWETLRDPVNRMKIPS